MKGKIKNIGALEILDSRGFPTVQAFVQLESGVVGSAAIPSGASTGTFEAHELRDGGTRFMGKGVQNAVKNIIQTIDLLVKGKSVFDQQELDQMMIEKDDSPQKKNLGANAILGVSLALSSAAAKEEGIELYDYLRRSFFSEEKEWCLPVPMMNVLNGGKHAIDGVDMQEFMIMPVGASTFSDALRSGVEVYHALKKAMKNRGLPVGVGDEGGFVASFKHHEEVFGVLGQAIETAGYKTGTDFVFALDPAASEFYENGSYVLQAEGKSLSSSEMINLYTSWTEKYPIRSIEDGLSEEDWDGFEELTTSIGTSVQIVGDDLFVTNTERLQKGIEKKAANAILVKLNQIGSLSETIKVIKESKKAGMNAIISHRSGETEDTFIADLVVAANTGQIKTGAPCRSERTAKYNRLLFIEHMLGKSAAYAKFPYAL